jgi:hypothetical protein
LKHESRIDVVRGLLVAMTLALGSCAHLRADTEFAESSKIELDSPNAVEIENLLVLAKVWGFLKYHHPRVASGELQWDFELFRVMQSVVATTDPDERNAVLLRWIEDFGEVPSCRKCASLPADAQLQPRLDWIRDEALLGAELSRALEHIWVNRHVGKKASVRTYGGKPYFLFEPAYAELEHVDAGYRLLAAFRVWNIIEWWFPYRDMIDEDWDGVLRELLPVFLEAHEREDYHRALLRLIARIDDSHANVGTTFMPPAGSCWVPARLRFIDDQLVVVRVYGPDPKLRAGDSLLSIEGQAVHEFIEVQRPYYAGSNEAALLRDIGISSLIGECGSLAVTVDRDGQALELDLERVPFSPDQAPPPGDTFQRLGEDVAYIKLFTTHVEAKDVRRYIEAAAGTRGLIVDIRNYFAPKGVPIEIGEHLVAAPTPFFRITRPDLDNPGAFTWAETYELQPRAPHYSGKVVILISEMTQSASETMTMAVRAAPRSVVIGSASAGANGNIVRIPLPGGERTGISGIGVFFPDGTPMQRVGIVPDIPVKPTREGVRDGRDEVLERALREILGPDVSEDELRELARQAD